MGISEKAAKLAQIEKLRKISEQKNEPFLVNLVENLGCELHFHANTYGGEWAGPCPKCGGEDRFFVQPFRHMGKCIGFFNCRQIAQNHPADIEKPHDIIQFLIDYYDLTFKEACTVLGGVKISTDYEVQQYSNGYVPEKPHQKWLERMPVFVDWCQQNIWKNKDAISYLAKRGLPEEAIRRYGFGYNTAGIDRPFFCDSAEDWGFEKGYVPLPKGIVIPHKYPSGDIVRATTRIGPGAYVNVRGSMRGYWVIGSPYRDCIVIFESPLDAYAADYWAGDIICAIAANGSGQAFDIRTMTFADLAKRIIVCRDNDPQGYALFRRFKIQYIDKTIDYPTSIGKDLGEAYEKGLDIREFLLAALPEYSNQHSCANSETLENAVVTEPEVLEVSAPELQEQKLTEITNSNLHVAATPEPGKDNQLVEADETTEPIEDQLVETNQPEISSATDKSCDWNEEDKKLIAQFRSLHEAHQLPKPPFLLASGVTVQGERFYESIEEIISYGCDSYQARNGVLQDRIRKVLALTEKTT